MASVQEVNKVQKGVRATLMNQTSAEMKLNRSMHWIGFSGPLPQTIPVGGVANFSGGAPSMAGLVYEGVTTQGDACAWVLAWDVPANLTPTTRNKVYATGGLKSEIDNITWAQIAEKLRSDIGIPIIPGPIGAYATITEEDDFAVLNARFYAN